MIGINNIELLRYFRQPETAFGKSVQRSWRFWGFFIYNPFSSETTLGAKGGILGTKQFMFDSINKDFPPIIQPFHILSVTIPTYKFEKNVMMYGQVPRSFPLLKFEGFDFSIEMEEDEQGTVDYFINWLQRKIIDNKGYYKAPNLMKIPNFILEIQDKMGIPVVYYNFHDIYFLNASEPIYAYSSNESIRRTVTFGCDRMSTIYTKQNMVAAIVGAGVAAGSLTKNLASETVGLTQYLGRKIKG